VSKGLARLRPAAPVVVIAALLALLPFPTCILRLALGVPCPACGLTRATLAAMHLDFGAALRWHPLSLALIAATALTGVAAFVASDRVWKKMVVVTTGAAGVLLIVVWVMRFAGWFGGPVPG
jgi:hypothetical protein